jgi:hypothetical protein
MTNKERAAIKARNSEEPVIKVFDTRDDNPFARTGWRVELKEYAGHPYFMLSRLERRKAGNAPWRKSFITFNADMIPDIIAALSAAAGQDMGAILELVEQADTSTAPDNSSEPDVIEFG